MMAEYTPGPWVVADDYEGHRTIYPFEEGQPRIATVIGGAHQEANARLIAAAPELLEALEHCVERLQCIKEGSPTLFGAALDFAHVAIAKARGTADD